jgi:hypothetical protein
VRKNLRPVRASGVSDPPVACLGNGLERTVDQNAQCPGTQWPPFRLRARMRSSPPLWPQTRTSRRVSPEVCEIIPERVLKAGFRTMTASVGQVWMTA